MWVFLGNREVDFVEPVRLYTYTLARAHTSTRTRTYTHARTYMYRHFVRNIAGFLVKEDCIQFNKSKRIYNSINIPKGPIVQARMKKCSVLLGLESSSSSSLLSSQFIYFI